MSKQGEKIAQLVKELEQQVLGGVAVFVFNDKGEVLLGKRKGSHGAGTYSLPGGHIDFGESVHFTVVREVFEETGLQVCITNDVGWSQAFFEKEQKHYITILFVVRIKGVATEPVLKEPDKCEGWQWYATNKLPEPLFAPLKNYLDNNQFPTP